MSGASAKREIGTGEKPATSHGKAPSRESANKVKGSPSHNKSRRSCDKKKMMRKVVYYETDSSSPSTSGSDTPSVTSKRRDKMRHHLTSLHTSIWDVVEIGVQEPSPGDEDYDSDEVAQIQHFNSQATTILLASLSREEYNKVQGLKSAKEIWDVLKTAHEGDEVTKITKRETIEGELGRFQLRQGEEPQDMYNRLKTLVNQVRNLGSTKWDDHDMVKVILRSLVFLNPTQVQLICAIPRYTLMSLKEVIGNFVSFELMIKGSKKIIELDGPSTSEAQPAHSRQRRRKRRSLHLVDNPLTPLSLTMRRWRSSSKASAKSSNKGGGRTTNPAPRKCATSVVSPVISLLNVHYLVIVTGATTRRERGEKRRDTTRRRAAMPMCVASGTPTRALRLLLRRGRRQHRRHQGTPLPQRRPQMPHGKGRQKKEGKIKILH
jgi:hypothetical protein